jgi:hypothetical protein
MFYGWLPTNELTAICVLSNRTSRHFFGFPGHVQTKTEQGWVENEGTHREGSTDIGPHAIWVLRFIPPPDTNSWRCSVTLQDDQPWKEWCLDLMRIRMRVRQYIVWSPELAR